MIGRKKNAAPERGEEGHFLYKRRGNPIKQNRGLEIRK